jgi:hypothetical protein
MSTDAQIQNRAEPSPVGDDRRDLPMCRFGLRQLLVFVAIVCLVLGAIVISGGVAALALLLGAMVILFHLFSTALGSHLRWHASQKLAQNGGRSVLSDSDGHAGVSRAPQPRPFSRSPWHGRGSTPLPWLPKFVIAMSLLGGAIGSALLTLVIGDRTTPSGIFVGTISIAVVMAWFAFLAGSFYAILRHGFSDAIAEYKNDAVDSQV